MNKIILVFIALLTSSNLVIATENSLQGQKDEIEPVIVQFQEKVSGNWKVPANTKTSEAPLVEIQLSPEGEVQTVKILESSGDKRFDDSVIKALYASSPIMFPDKLYHFFKLLRIRFHPLPND